MNIRLITENCVNSINSAPAQTLVSREDQAPDEEVSLPVAALEVASAVDSREVWVDHGQQHAISVVDRITMLAIVKLKL